MVNGKGRKMIGIVIPVFNDWESLNRLIRKLNDQSATLIFDFHIFVVDDGSTEPRHLDYLSTTTFGVVTGSTTPSLETSTIARARP